MARGQAAIPGPHPHYLIYNYLFISTMQCTYCVQIDNINDQDAYGLLTKRWKQKIAV